MARNLSRVPRRVKELRAPKMMDRVAVTAEHGQHRSLRPLRGLGEVVAVVCIGGRGQESQLPPATLLCEAQEARQWGLSEDGQVEVLARVLRSAVELVEKRHARGAWSLFEGQA